MVLRMLGTSSLPTQRELYELVATAESRGNGHANGHTTQIPPPDAPAFEIAAGGQQRIDPN